jgi:hypothetical protein
MNGQNQALEKFKPAVRVRLEQSDPSFLGVIDTIIDTRTLSSKPFKKVVAPSTYFRSINLYAKDFDGHYKVELMTVTPTAAIFTHTKVYNN